MTVAELIAALEEMPQHLEVHTEGCDCYGDVGSVYLDKDWDTWHYRKSRGEAAVLLQRPVEPARIPTPEELEKKVLIKARREERLKRQSEIFKSGLENMDGKGGWKDDSEGID